MQSLDAQRLCRLCRARQHRGLCTARQSLLHWRLQPHRDKGLAIVDGLPDEVRCLAAGGESDQPTPAETAAICEKVAKYQAILDTH